MPAALAFWIHQFPFEHWDRTILEWEAATKLLVLLVLLVRGKWTVLDMTHPMWLYCTGVHLLKSDWSFLSMHYKYIMTFKCPIFIQTLMASTPTALNTRKRLMPAAGNEQSLPTITSVQKFLYLIMTAK